MHLKRLLIASIIIPLFYFFVTRLNEIYFFALVVISSLIALWELYSMFRVSGPMRNAGLLLGISILATAYISRNLFSYAIILSFLILSSVRLFEKRDPGASLHDISVALLPVLYVPGLLAFQLFLRHIGAAWIIFLFGCVWISDSLALYIGGAFGRRKLYKEVSPNKTVAGAFGSLLGGSLSGWLLNVYLLHAMGLWESILIGFMIGMTAIIGDLVESMFKRDAGVKDSGGIIPGHGGMLDKIDGVLFAGPVFYWVSLGLRLIE